jgi:RNA 2',3'-cyclic 3'-phosphodiesterase
VTLPFRAFISADLPVIPTIEALARELRETGQDLKVVSVDRLHLTLKFLGDTEEGLVPEIVAAMHEASAGIPAFTIRVRGTGGFPSLARPRVLWVGLEGGEPLSRMAKSLDENVAALGFERERRPWSPHVTLARVRGSRGLDRTKAILRAHADELFAEARVEEIRLKKSVLRPQGPEYTTVESVRLEG